MSCTPQRSKFSNFVIEYLGEIESKFEITLACSSVAQIGSNHLKKMEIENLMDTLPFNLNLQLISKVYFFLCGFLCFWVQALIIQKVNVFFK